MKSKFDYNNTKIDWGKVDRVIDGSNKIQYKKNKKILKKYLVEIDKIDIKHINSKK